MRQILTCFLSLIITTTAANAQICQVTASASTSAVCLGNPVTISATATATLPANQFFDFNQNQLPQGWSTTGGTNYSSNICGSSPDGTPYFWASTASGVPQIVTADFDVCSGGYLEFELRYAIQAGASPCEGPDEVDEGISLEYSLNGGATWVEFLYYRPDGVTLPANPGSSGAIAVSAGQTTSLTSWATYNVPIPAAAISSSTRFRWVQRFSSGGCCDNWGLDNIGVIAGPCLTTNLVWSNGMSGVGSFTFTPTADTCFTANLYDDNNNFLCSDDVCITVNPLFASSFDTTICQGQTVMFGPTSSALLPYTTSGSYPATFTAITGCDSVVTMNLTVTAPTHDTVDVTICSGATYMLGGVPYTTPGTFTDTLSSMAGCDSVVTINLLVTPPIQDTIDVTVCYGDSYTLGGTSYAATGTYTDTLSTAAGCDSVVTLNLTVKPQITATVNTSICQGDTYTLGTQSITTAGNYQEVFTAADGCDSTVTLNLGINPVYVGNFDTALCAGVTYTYGGHVFSGAGSYPVHFQTVHGCDSNMTLTITIMPAPVPDAGPDLVLCSDEVGNLGGAAIPGASYTWTGGADLSDDTIAAPTVSVHSLVPVTNTYVVTAFYQGCVASDSVNVAIVPYPVVNLQAVAPQCFEGNVFAFTAGQAFLPGAVYDWDIPGAVPSSGVTQEVSGVWFTTPGTHQTVLTVSHGTCTSSDTLDVTVNDEPQASMQALPVNGCIPLLVQLQNTSVPATVSSIWNFGNGQTSTNTSPSVTYTQAGSYDVLLVVVSPEGCVDSASYPQAVTAYPLPEAGFLAHPAEVFQDDGFVFVTDNSVGATTWSYTVSNGSEYATPGFTNHFYDTGYYYIHQVVTNQYGCTDEHEQSVHVAPATSFYIPNAFTPGNTDGINSYFGAYGNYVDNFHMIIFDRWGMKVFESRDMEERWDGTIKGKIIKQDVYVYKITYLDHHAIEQELHGHVTLIR